MTVSIPYRRRAPSARGFHSAQSLWYTSSVRYSSCIFVLFGAKFRLYPSALLELLMSPSSARVGRFHSTEHRASAPRRPDFRRQPRRSHCDSPCTSSQLTEEHKLSLSLSLLLSVFIRGVDLVPRQLSVSCCCLRRCVTNSSCSTSSLVCTVCMSATPESRERHPTGQNRRTCSSFFRRMIFKCRLAFSALHRSFGHDRRMHACVRGVRSSTALGGPNRGTSARLSYAYCTELITTGANV